MKHWLRKTWWWANTRNFSELLFNKSSINSTMNGIFATAVWRYTLLSLICWASCGTLLLASWDTSGINPQISVRHINTMGASPFSCSRHSAKGSNSTRERSMSRIDRASSSLQIVVTTSCRRFEGNSCIYRRINHKRDWDRKNKGLPEEPRFLNAESSQNESAMHAAQLDCYFLRTPIDTCLEHLETEWRRLSGFKTSQPWQ